MADSNYDGKFTIVGGVAPVVTMQSTAPNEVGEFEVRGTFIANGTTHTLRMGNGYTTGDSWYDDLAVVSPTTQTETRRNLVSDPRATSITVPSGTIGYRTTRWFGSSPAAGSHTLVTGGVGPTLPDGTVLTTYLRKTWTTAPPAIGSSGDTGFEHGTSFAVNPGETLTASSYLRPSVQRNFEMSFQFYDGVGAAVGARSRGVLTPGAPNVWTRIYQQGVVVPAGAVTVQIVSDSTLHATTGAVNWAVGSTLDGTGLLVERSAVVNDFFDGFMQGIAPGTVYGWSGTPNASPSIELSSAVYTGDFFYGASPDATGRVYDWAGAPNASDSVAYGSYPGSVIGTTPHVDSEPQGYVIEDLRPGTRYDVQVRAISVFGVPGLLSSVLSFNTADAEEILTAPTAPILDTGLGGVTANWDGELEGGSLAPGFKYVYGEWTMDPETPYAPFGTALTGPGSLNLSDVPMGQEVFIRLRAVDNLGRISEPSSPVSIVVKGVTGPDIEANTVTANEIAAFTITTNELHPSVGDTLDISANGTINIIAGVAQDAYDVANTAQAEIEAQRTVYSFTSTEAIISSDASEYQLALDPNGIEIRKGPEAAPVSWWDSEGMHVTSFNGEKVILSNHQLEKYGTGTVVRRVANI